MVELLLRLVVNIHLVYLRFLVLLQNPRKLLIGLEVVNSLLLRVLPKRSLPKPQKIHSSTSLLVEQLRSTLRIMLALETLRSRKKLHLLLMLPSDSVHGGDLMVRSSLLDLRLKNSVEHTLADLDFNLKYTQLPKDLNGDLIDHHLAMSILFMETLVDLRSPVAFL